jgi:hypothetical protein
MAALTSGQMTSVTNYLRAKQPPSVGLPLITPTVLAAALDLVSQLSAAGAVDASTALSTSPWDVTAALDIVSPSAGGVAMRDGEGYTPFALQSIALSWLKGLGLVTSQSLAAIPSGRRQIIVDDSVPDQPVYGPCDQSLDAVALSMTAVAAVVTAGW